MPNRIRTTKQLAERITRDYFKKLFLIPAWKRYLSLGLVVAGIGWLLFKGQPAYNAGPLSRGHQIVGAKCEACHVPSFFGSTTSDVACLTCHDAPTHQAKQTFTPQCSACHVEHQGSFKLARTSEASCTQCHSSLKVKEGKAQFALEIKSLTSGHPEFAAIRPGHPSDPGKLKLNHQIHLKKDLKTPTGSIQLVCNDCHQPSLPKASNESKDPLELIALRATQKGISPTLAPVTFEQHCKSCHPLVYDKRFPDDVVPHKETGVVQPYVVDKYTAYIAKHPNEVHEPVPLNPDLPTRPVPPPPRNAAEWILQRVEEADRLLWQKTCKECHILTYPAPSLRPEVPRPQAAVRWMKNAWFDHKPHQLVACAECHADAPKSQKTEDVLLPGIPTCQKCHADSSASADSRCSECHVYHDWSKAKPVKNALTIPSVGR